MAILLVILVMTAQFVKLGRNVKQEFLLIVELNINQVKGKVFASNVLLEKIAVLGWLQIVQLVTTVNLETIKFSAVVILSQT